MDFHMRLDEIKILSKNRQKLGQQRQRENLMTFPSCNQEEKLIAV